MKPSKLLKEYIEERVREVYGKTSPIEEKYEKAKAEFEEEVKKANNKIKEYAQQVAKEIINPYEFKHSFSSDGTRIYDYCWGDNNMSTLWNEKEQVKKERLAKIDNTIKDILVELELGGTKAQLEERLAQLGKEKN